MNARMTIRKDGKVIVSAIYEIENSADWENACAEIWRRARQAHPLARQNANQFLSGLEDLWGATMQIDKA